MAARLEAPSLMPHGPQRKGERFSLPHIHRPTKTYQRSAGKSPANAQSRRFAESQQAPAAQILIHSTSRAAKAPTRCTGSRRASKSVLNLAMRIIMAYFGFVLGDPVRHHGCGSGSGFGLLHIVINHPHPIGARLVSGSSVTISNETRQSFVNASALTRLLARTNKSAPPSSGLIKPKPRSS